jgi:hypothetical protein
VFAPSGNEPNQPVKAEPAVRAAPSSPVVEGFSRPTKSPTLTGKPVEKLSTPRSAGPGGDVVAGAVGLEDAKLEGG